MALSYEQRDALIADHQRLVARHFFGPELGPLERSRWEAVKAALDRDQMRRMAPALERLEAKARRWRRMASELGSFLNGPVRPGEELPG